jgi:hypothetical protein
VRGQQLSDEYVAVLGGADGAACRLFESLFGAGFRALRARVDELTLLLDIMQPRTCPNRLTARSAAA